MKPLASDAVVFVVGAGIMGTGIAQTAAQAGHRVLLHDLRDGAAADAKARLAASLNSLVTKGKLAEEAAAVTLSRIEPASGLISAVPAALVVEAIVERLDAKRQLFRDLEAVVSADCVLATNTSSISVTAIANGLAHPGRLVGMHFFNPVPLMRLVEVVSGLHTDPAVAEAISELAWRWHKVPVQARSTPGFIVNRIARPFYAEALALLSEHAAEPIVIDNCLRGVGFRMGPCELMDLIGHDTNFAVTQSVYDANFQDKRYVPSLVQREMVEGGLLGRKSGRGFYDHREGTVAPKLLAFEAAQAPESGHVVVHGAGPVAEGFAAALTGRAVERDTASGWTGVEADGCQLRLTDGWPASAFGADVAVFDLPPATLAGAASAPGVALAWAPSVRASAAWIDAAPRWLRAAGFHAQRVADTPGLIVARTIAMLVNEAADAVQQGVCTPDGADAAMKLGVNYPAGPFEWLARWEPRCILGVLDALDAHYRGERYRVSPELRRRVWMAA